MMDYERIAEAAWEKCFHRVMVERKPNHRSTLPHFPYLSWSELYIEEREAFKDAIKFGVDKVLIGIRA